MYSSEYERSIVTFVGLQSLVEGFAVAGLLVCGGGLLAFRFDFLLSFQPCLISLCRLFVCAARHKA